MGKFFGTDGVRGIANSELSCELAIKIGRAAAYVLTRHTSHKAKIIIGKDTRISGDMLESVLAAGICSVGADCVLLGVVPTPAVAHLVKKYNADAGIVISASHNPVEFNGIKLINGTGFKLPDNIENEIEDYILNRADEIELKTHGDIGSIVKNKTAVKDYVDYLTSCIKQDISGMKVVFDCANGAAYETARMLFDRLNVEATYIGTEPDGKNINKGVGSTHLDNVKNEVLRTKSDIGISFDGDADRCLAVDELGNEIDGDKIIGVFAKSLKQKGELNKNTVVVTVMSNLGFIDFCKKNDIITKRTSVGDRYVLEEMLRGNYVIGGEQSGHVISLNHATTGDGELTAALLLEVLKESGVKASELFGQIEKYPQVMINVTANKEQKKRFKEDEELEGFIEAEQQELFETGRVLVRVSGTEPLIRIMVEGKDYDKILQSAKAIETEIKKRII